jgi:hypothetical protein
MFSAIYNGDVARLMTLGTTDFLRDRNKPATLLCLDHTFRDCNRHTDITGSGVQILNKTGFLRDYANLVWQILSLPEPWADTGVQRLFSFTVHSGLVCLPRGTFLHGFVEPSQQSQLLDEGTKVEVRIFLDLYQGFLRRRLIERLEAYSNNSLSVRVFDPCESIAFGRCDRRMECQRQHDLNHTWFEKRLLFHMCQISILSFVSTGIGQNLRRSDLLLLICSLSANDLL